MLEDIFEKRGELFVGYHVEGDETGVLPVIPSLSLEGLDNNRPLFICKNPSEWFPSHLPNSGLFVVYEILFTEVSYHLYTDCNEYMESVPHLAIGYKGSRELLDMVDENKHLFILDKNNQGELTEACLMFPKQYIRSIQPVFFPNIKKLN